jgi:hypothetical protein
VKEHVISVSTEVILQKPQGNVTSCRKMKKTLHAIVNENAMSV